MQVDERSTSVMIQSRSPFGRLYELRIRKPSRTDSSFSFRSRSSRSLQSPHTWRIRKPTGRFRWLRVVQVLPVSLRPDRTGRVDRSFRDLELPVVDEVPNVAMDTRCVDLVPVDLAASKFRDQHRGIHRAFFPGEIAKLFLEIRA